MVHTSTFVIYCECHAPHTMPVQQQKYTFPQQSFLLTRPTTHPPPHGRNLSNLILGTVSKVPRIAMSREFLLRRLLFLEVMFVRYPPTLGSDFPLHKITSRKTPSAEKPQPNPPPHSRGGTREWNDEHVSRDPCWQTLQKRDPPWPQSP
jgi:hypothetical protein